jgi:hypothetical protein
VPKPHEWLLLATLLYLTDRYRWLMDDAFIYFRYIDNLLFLDRGLVYNAGEYVEGYSSPLWLLGLIPLRALTIDYYTLVRVLALAIAGSYGVALIWLNRRLSPPGPIVNFPLAASAAHYGLTTHFSSGLETPLVQLIAPLYAAALQRPESRALQAVVALAPLVRAENGLLGLLFLPWSIYRTRRVPIWFLALGLIANAGWLAFRVTYYADFLPNTFYLKDAEQWGLGLQYLQNVSETHAWPWVLLFVVTCAIIGRKQLARTDLGSRAIMLTAAIAYAVYVARIGGDMLYHRYAALPVCLLLCATAGVVEAAVLQLPAARLRLPVAIVVSLLVTFWFGFRYPPTLESHPLFLPEDSRKWFAIADPNWHRRHSSLEYRPERAQEDARTLELYERQRLRGEPAAPKIKVMGFCRQAYRRSEMYIVHDFGLTDLVLARLPRPFGRPGHKFVQAEAAHVARLRERARQTGMVWYDLPKAARWVKDNRDALALLERKLHNRHDFGENLELALTRVQLR